MKKMILIFLMFFCLTLNVKADSINKITMDIYLDSFGTAHITEKWDVVITSGTEGYKPYYNIGNAEFTDFKVSYNNEEFTSISTWLTNKSFEEKSYKNGINYLSNGLELCWGISEYGKNIYTLKYNIEGFVAEAEDSQMIYWTLIPYELSLKPQEVNIIIRSDNNFEDTIPVWGYGNYGGTAYVYDGLIEISSDGLLDSDEYMTILVKLPKGTFQTDNFLEETFAQYYEMAKEGSTTYKDKPNYLEKAFDIFISLFTFIIIIFVGLWAGLKSKNKNFEKQISKGKFPKDLNYYRDIPCNKNLFYAYFLAINYNMTKNKNDFLGALILSWIKNGYVEIEKKPKKGIFKKGEESILRMHLDKYKEKHLEEEIDYKMFNYMYDASIDGVLEPKEFSDYCQENYKEILEWFDDVLNASKEECFTKGLLTKEKKFTTKYYETELIYEEAKKLSGLKKFLKDFSSIEDKRAIEVHLWEYYLIFAQIFGIANEVATEFKKLYPDVITDFSTDDLIFIHAMSYGGMQSATTAQMKAESYTAGGGGFSSGGGGGGSFGGGGGGGGFR
ncbi:MAG: DUF2207 domain-containing protein [Bacilli bacterium]|nr:DUF2207 domain-containing protein [Bacilli bacterium]